MAQRAQQLVILGEESRRTRGRDAQSMNIAAGRAVGAAVRSTLGPTGMDKMLVSDTGMVTVTNDGATILDKLAIQHPAAQLIVEVASAQADETGDGTTTATVLASELLGEAEDLLEQGIHPTSIAGGYRIAADRALEYLEETAVSVDAGDTETLRKIAKTAMTGKGPGVPLDHLAELTVQAVQQVADDDRIDLDNIKVDAIPGGTVLDSSLTNGVLVHKEPLLDEMPTRIEDPKVALVSADIDVRTSERDLDVDLSHPDQFRGFRDREEAELRESIDAILDAGADVVFCRKAVGDRAKHWFADAGVLAFRRIRESDMKHLARATGAEIVSDVAEFTEDDLGSAGLLEHRDVGDDYRIFVEDCPNPGSVGILLRGGTEQIVDELERTIDDALQVCRVTIEDGTVLPGGGAPEIGIATDLFEHADGVGGREQLGIRAFAEAISVIPRTLAVNAGAEPLDVLTELRSRHSSGEVNAGYSARAGVTDVWEEGVVEPLRVKTQSITSAQEAAELLVRIDDVISATELTDIEESDEDDIDI